MPGTLTPAQMFDHTMVELSGRSVMHALDFSAEPAAGEVSLAGQVCTLNSNGKFVVGLGSGVANTQVYSHNAPMAIFMIQGTNEFDANSDVGNMAGGKQSGIVATGGYEIQTTEYVAGTYRPNDTLTFATGASIGKVTMSDESYNDCHLLGVVSTGVTSNADSKSVLSFWTVYLPAFNGTALNNSSSSSSSSSSSMISSAS
jgi:hypothetical protein